MDKLNKIKTSQIFGEFWKGLKIKKAAFFLIILWYIIASLAQVLTPVYYKKFFDYLGASFDKVEAVPILIGIILTVVSLKLVRWFFYRSGDFIFDALKVKVIAKLKQNAFDYTLRHSYTFFANNFTGGLVQRVNRFTRAFESLIDIFIYNLLPLVITLVAALLVTFLNAPWVSLAILIWIILFMSFNIPFSLWRIKYDIGVAAADSRTTGYLTDVITNNNAVSLFTANSFESSGFGVVTKDQADKTRFSWYLGDIVDTVQGLLLISVEFFVFYFVIKGWGQGWATIGTFVLAQTYIIDLGMQLWGSSKTVRRIYEALADSREMVEILKTPYEIKDSPDAKELTVKKGEIVFENVGFNFNETREVINDLNITIKPGEKLAIVGPSGAGKTTFVRLIMRLYDLTKGSIKIDGQDIHLVTQDSLRENISLVPQDPVLFHRTLLENIRYGRRDATDDEVKEAARLAHCDEFIENLPYKYDTFVGERGIKLSGGERQRVAIARAILKKAPILILDEATSSLDSHSEMLIQDALNNLMKDCTTIVIAHRLSTIRKMDRIIAMKDGQIVEEGTHDELANKDSGLYKKLWDLQAGGFVVEE